VAVLTFRERPAGEESLRWHGGARHGKHEGEDLVAFEVLNCLGRGRHGEVLPGSMSGRHRHPTGQDRYARCQIVRNRRIRVRCNICSMLTDSWHRI